MQGWGDVTNQQRNGWGAGEGGAEGPRSTAAKEIYTESLWGKGNAKSFVAPDLENVSLGTEPEDTANSVIMFFPVV